LGYDITPLSIYIILFSPHQFYSRTRRSSFFVTQRFMFQFPTVIGNNKSDARTRQAVSTAALRTSGIWNNVWQ